MRFNESTLAYCCGIAEIGEFDSSVTGDWQYTPFNEASKTEQKLVYEQVLKEALEFAQKCRCKLVVFSDINDDIDVGGHLCRDLRKKGYKVTKTAGGPSQNKDRTIYLYVWHTQKARKPRSRK